MHDEIDQILQDIMKNVKEPLDLISPELLKEDEQFLIDLNYEMFPQEEVKLFRKKEFLVIWKSYFSSGEKRYDQNVFPLKALAWFVYTIEEMFWGKHHISKQPGDISETIVINEEKIGIKPMKHCCAENLFGYSFWNASRVSYISELPPQEWHIPRYMLENGLLKKLKFISEELNIL